MLHLKPLKTISRKELTREAIAGLTTFLTVSYIIVVNPAILSTEGTGMPFSGVATATVLLCILMTAAMGIYAGLPFAVAPGMGINAFFTYSLILGQGVPWQQALGVVFWAGVIFLVLSVTPLREWIARSMPASLRTAAAAGIGLFLTFIGLKNAGIVASHPVTFVQLGHLDTRSVGSIAGVFVAVALMRRKNPAAFLLTILAVTSWEGLWGRVGIPPAFTSSPDFHSVLGKLDIWGALQPALIPALISILFTDLFDSISTFVGVSQATGFVDSKGNPKNLREGLIVDAWATLGAGILGTSSGTAYIESAAGIEAGARTGWASVFTAALFIPCLFLSPLVAMIPSTATAPVLIVVGALMVQASIASLRFKTLEEWIPPFLTLLLIPLTFSITQGILWGFVAHGVIFVLCGRSKELSRFEIGMGLISAALLYVETRT